MAEYIQRETLLERAEYDNNYRLIIPAEALKAAHAADVVPVVHGRWVDRIVNENEVIQPWMKRYYCSECIEGGNQSWFKFCPNCGAKMDGGADND